MCAPACATSSIGCRVRQLRARDAVALGAQQELDLVHARLAKAGVDYVRAPLLQNLGTYPDATSHPGARQEMDVVHMRVAHA